jgi:hypothetical protein
MKAFAANITSADACASDLSAQNPLVAQAHLGLLAYETMYTASCLHNPTTSSYCFADAVTNISSPTDSYIYYLPLNASLPGGTVPTCDPCLKDTMAIFQQASADKTSAIASVYVSAASLIDVQCGPTFINKSIPIVDRSNGALAEKWNSPLGLVALLVLVGSWLL